MPRFVVKKHIVKVLKTGVKMESIEHYKPGEIVVREGMVGSSAYIIQSGSVEVLKKAGGREISIATLQEGQVFGEMGLIEDQPRSATVKAITELDVRVIDRGKFNELFCSSPVALIPILKILFERLRETSELLAEKVTKADWQPEKQSAVTVVLEGQTEESKGVLGNEILHISKFPFFIGRFSINQDTDLFNNNDLFIKEQAPYVVSRNHMAIVNEGGIISVVDRGSSFGTVVNGKEIGGKNRSSRIPIEKTENQLIVGPATSRYIFMLKIISPDPLPAGGL